MWHVLFNDAQIKHLIGLSHPYMTNTALGSRTRGGEAAFKLNTSFGGHA